MRENTVTPFKAIMDVFLSNFASPVGSFFCCFTFLLEFFVVASTKGFFKGLGMAVAKYFQG